MTKTFTTVVSNRFKSLGLPEIIPLVMSVGLALVWNFEIGSLGFICILFFVAWNFYDSHYAVKFFEVFD
jgi:hypothetical protein